METEGAKLSVQGPSSSTTMSSSQTLISQPSSESSANTDNGTQSEQPPLAESVSKQTDVLKAVELVEKDSLSIADSFTSLFASLRLALSESTTSSIDHMQCFSDATSRIQESAIEAATRGNRFIISCHRLNQEMKGIDSLAMQLKIMRRNVDALDVAVNRCFGSTDTTHKLMFGAYFSGHTSIIVFGFKL